ncbi:hypothetical protein N7462_007128 [Penicillium macrosclerotiorum]|uniref:uncharacterized protein n=1 Tax=Penicillium macrosclerotiorum TaxID=303699 RepID=UPI0025484308|nr:uncharacterized protein N7462_007128 [Penicillium macrosclerotiorum]KAJ5678884.1 hypothetical protein N7462_007128 [Penicillium macrosclerotiorum]
MSLLKGASSTGPPPPPPPPADPRAQIPLAVLKLRTVSPDRHFPKQISRRKELAPVGPYFLYGSLLDPQMLVEILGLGVTPKLRPAYIEGFTCQLWGQYPALLEQTSGGIVEGCGVQCAIGGRCDKAGRLRDL